MYRVKPYIVSMYYVWLCRYVWEIHFFSDLGIIDAFQRYFLAMGTHVLTRFDEIELLQFKHENSITSGRSYLNIPT